MPRYKDYNHKQNAMVVIHFKEQIQPGTFEHAVHYLTDYKLDLTFFNEVYKNDRTGRVAYDPTYIVKNHFICLFKRYNIKPKNCLVLQKQYYSHNTVLPNIAPLYHDYKFY